MVRLEFHSTSKSSVDQHKIRTVPNFPDLEQRRNITPPSIRLTSLKRIAMLYPLRDHTAKADAGYESLH